MQNFERNDGRKFDAIIEVNNDGLSRSKFAISGISQWLEDQKKQVARMNEIIDLQFDMLDNKIKLKSIKK